MHIFCLQKVNLALKHLFSGFARLSPASLFTHTLSFTKWMFSPQLIPISDVRSIRQLFETSYLFCFFVLCGLDK